MSENNNTGRNNTEEYKDYKGLHGIKPIDGMISSPVFYKPSESGKQGAFTFKFQKIYTLMKKNITLYFKKGPVIIFGFIFPIFLMISWIIGRNIPSQLVFTGITAMSAFFTSTALSPVVMPIETADRSLERQIALPLSIDEIVAGISLSSSVFSGTVSILITFVFFFVLSIPYHSIMMLITILIGVILLCIIGSLLGVLISAKPAERTSDIMVIITLIKFPLVFMSGIFVPLSDVGITYRVFSFLSPVTPLVDIIHGQLGVGGIFPTEIDLGILLIWMAILGLITPKIHKKTVEKRFYSKIGMKRRYMMNMMK